MGMTQELAAYRQTVVESASPVELVIMLCDVLVKDLNQVSAAIRVRDIEERVRHSNHAFDVLKELDRMLDFENGGNTAKELAGVYSYVRAKLMESQFKLDPAVVECQVEFITEIRNAWQKSLNTSKQSATSVPAPKLPEFAEGDSYLYASLSEEVQNCNWSA